MARDRQRSKARKRARAAGGETPPRKRREEPAAGETTPETIADTTPNELEGAVPYVDEAHLAEAGADVPAPVDDEDDGYGEDFDRAEDQVEIPRDLVQSRTRGADGEVRETEDHQGGGRVLTFLRACVEELRRVQWPDRKHVFSATAVVLGFVLIAGGWLGLVDAIWQPLINAIL